MSPTSVLTPFGSGTVVLFAVEDRDLVAGGQRGSTQGSEIWPVPPM